MSHIRVLICRGNDPTCEQMSELAVFDLPAAADSGYEINDAEGIYWGRCPGCVAATSISSGALKRTHRLGHQLEDTALKPEQLLLRATSHHLETPSEERNQRA